MKRPQPTTKIARFERRVLNGIKKHLAAGGRLILREFTDGRGGVCALGTICKYRSGDNRTFAELRSKCRMTKSQVLSFIRGFDDDYWDGSEKAYYAIGMKIRMQFRKVIDAK